MSRLVIELLSLEKGKAFGFQEYIFNLLNYFYHHRKSILYDEIIIWCKDSSVDMLEKFEDKFEIISFSYSSYIKRHWLQTILPIKYKLTKSDLLFSPGNISGLIKCGKEVLTIHDLLYKRKEWLPSILMRWQRDIMVPISIKKADKIVAISEFTKSDIEYYYPQAKGKIEVIYNSFNFGKYDGDEKAIIGHGYFLAISNSANYKNLKTILAAFQEYYNKGGKKILVFIGKIKEGSDAFKQYQKIPDEIKYRIVCKSKITNSELGTYYRGASCFVSASKFEGLGMPVVEAMSFGVPVLLSDIPPHREVSKNLGEYFMPDSVEDLSSKMLSMEFGKRNYDVTIKEIFSEENTSARYVNLINSFK